MTAAQVKVLLTFLWRGERFAPGLWGQLHHSGLTASLLERLAELYQAGAVSREAAK